MDIEDTNKEKPIEELIKFGVLNIDKPSNCTSFDVVNLVRRSLGLDKAGHLGTLDPQVTGVLPIVLGKACKIQEYFMHRDKTYIGVMKLHKEITRKQLEEEMEKFLGVINQLPPRISRVKRVVRKRKIVEFKLLSFDKDKREAEFISKVEAGTYIRKLIDDLGKNIGGAQMISLRRTHAGIFSDKDKEFCTIEKFKEAVDSYKNGNESKLKVILIPAEIILKLVDSVEVKAEAIPKLFNGSPLFESMIDEPSLEKSMKVIGTNEPFAVVHDGRIIEIARKTEQFQNEDILAKPEVVLK